MNKGMIIEMVNYGFIQQLGVRCVRRTNNEPRVERNRLDAVITYGVIVKRFEDYHEDLVILFFLQ